MSAPVTWRGATRWPSGTVSADLKVALDGYLGWEGLSSQTIGAVEIALWDILGKTLGAPVHQLLGGRAYPIPLYGTGTTMFEQSHDWHAHYFDQCVALGFKGIKVRLGRAVDEDVELVELVREHVGPDLLIGVDSYWFHDVDSAIELATRIAPYRIHFFEEPIPQYQIEGLERLQHSSPSASPWGSGCTPPGRSPNWPAGTLLGSSNRMPRSTAGSCPAWRSPTSPPVHRSR